MRKICTLLLSVVLFMTSVLLVACGAETQAPPDYSELLRELIEKIDELTDKDTTVNVDPNITVETPNYTNQINELLGKIDELLAREDKPDDLSELYEKLDALLEQMQKADPTFMQVMSVEYASGWDTITLSSHFILSVDTDNETQINEQDFDEGISIDIDNLTANITQDKSNLPDLNFEVGKAVHYIRGGEYYSATLTAWAVNYVEVKILSDRQIVVKTVDGESHFTTDNFIVKYFSTETAQDGGL